jgi:hypothetical protein
MRYIAASSVTYDHRTLKTRLPVRSTLFKQRTGGLVVRWVTTSEYPLLYVFCAFVNADAFCFFSWRCVAEEDYEGGAVRDDGEGWGCKTWIACGFNPQQHL